MSCAFCRNPCPNGYVLPPALVDLLDVLWFISCSDPSPTMSNDLPFAGDSLFVGKYDRSPIVYAMLQEFSCKRLSLPEITQRSFD